MAESVKAVTMDEFMKTPYYQGLGIDRLEGELAGYQVGDEELRKQAEAEYRPAYESEREAAKQEYDRTVQGYNAQIAGTDAAYDRERRRTDQAYRESAAEMNNALTKRGLGRSSLVSTQGAYLQNQRNQALAEIDRAQGDAIQAINEKIALLTEQAAQSERTMAANYTRQLDNRVNERKEKNKNASVSLQLQISALQQQGYEAYQDWLLKNRQQELEEREFEERYGETGGTSSSSSASSSGGSGGGTQRTGAKQTAEQKKGSVSEAAGTVVSGLSSMIKKLASGLASGIQAASAAKKTGTAADTARQTGKTWQNSIRQKAKE